VTAPATAVEELIVLDNLTEQTIRFEAVGSGDPMMQIGDGATFFNNIYDADDNIVGNTVGIVIATMKRPDGNLVTEYTEVVQVPGGTLRSSALINRSQFFMGSTIQLEVTGMSGRFAGMRGIRECQLQPPYPPRPDTRVTVKIVMHHCPEGTDGRFS
jgi:hypothetical protein